MLSNHALVALCVERLVDHRVAISAEFGDGRFALLSCAAVWATRSRGLLISFLSEVDYTLNSPVALVTPSLHRSPVPWQMRLVPPLQRGKAGFRPLTPVFQGNRDGRGVKDRGTSNDQPRSRRRGHA